MSGDPGTRSATEVADDPAQVAYRQALADGRLVLPQCQSCGTLVWYPRTQCPTCMSDELEPRTMSGRATLYSYTANQRANSSQDGGPTLIAYVDLDEGPRLLATFASVRTADLRVGMALIAVMDRAPSGLGTLRFTRAPQSENGDEHG